MEELRGRWGVAQGRVAQPPAVSTTKFVRAGVHSHLEIDKFRAKAVMYDMNARLLFMVGSSARGYCITNMCMYVRHRNCPPRE